jgi:hypothetical protein
VASIKLDPTQPHEVDSNGGRRYRALLRACLTFVKVDGAWRNIRRPSGSISQLLCTTVQTLTQFSRFFKGSSWSAATHKQTSGVGST